MAANAPATVAARVVLVASAIRPLASMIAPGPRKQDAVAGSDDKDAQSQFNSKRVQQHGFRLELVIVSQRCAQKKTSGRRGAISRWSSGKRTRSASIATTTSTLASTMPTWMRSMYDRQKELRTLEIGSFSRAMHRVTRAEKCNGCCAAPSLCCCTRLPLLRDPVTV